MCVPHSWLGESHGPIDRINATEVDVAALGLYTWKGSKINPSFNMTANDLVNFPGSKYSDLLSSDGKMLLA